MPENSPVHAQVDPSRFDVVAAEIYSRAHIVGHSETRSDMISHTIVNLQPRIKGSMIRFLIGILNCAKNCVGYSSSQGDLQRIRSAPSDKWSRAHGIAVSLRIERIIGQSPASFDTSLNRAVEIVAGSSKELFVRPFDICKLIVSNENIKVSIASLQSPTIPIPNRSYSDGILEPREPCDATQRTFRGNVLRVVQTIVDCYYCIADTNIQSELRAWRDKEPIEFGMVNIVLITEPDRHVKACLPGELIRHPDINGR